MQKSILVTLFLFTFLFSSCTNNTDEITSTSECSLVNPSATVNETEIEMMKFMREEEKLAYDVYRYLYTKYGFNIFNNISESEKQHMDQVLCLLNYYKIQDSASPVAGIFNNPELQTLYNDLTVQGDISLLEALKVGATIEDVDIKDLMDLSTSTTNPAILSIFSNLTCGSRNHLRSFVSNINAQGGSYTPQFISVALYNQILSTPREQCNAH